MPEYSGVGGPARVIGTGLLAGAVAAELAHLPGPDRVGLLVVASDAWDTSGHDDARQLAAGSRPWLPVYTTLGHAVVGPLEEPGRPGCVACAATRRRRLLTDRAELAAVWREHHAQLATRPASWLTGLAADLVAGLVADEHAALDRGQDPRTRRALLRVGLATLAVTRHPFLPEPACPVCGGAVADDPPTVLTPGQWPPGPAYRPGSYRTRRVADEFDSLLDTYVDSEVGLVREISTWREGSLLVAAAPTGLRTGVSESGYGRSSGFRDSRLTALLEALERFGACPTGRQPPVIGSFAELSEDALDPRTLGLYPPERHELPGFGYDPFSTEKPYRWVWGWSFAGQRPVLVPEFYAYYGRRPIPDEPFVYEISNGCALGGCLAEAILYGILEVAERDAFLLTWYARLSAPRISLEAASDRTLPLLVASIRAETGYEIALFDITTESGIPCVWALARNPRPEDGRPAVVCAAGSHPNPERAVHNALVELTPLLGHLIRRYAEPGAAARARRMVEDPGLVQHMDDHSLLYADPVAAQRLDFLIGADQTRPVGEVGTTALPDADLTAALSAAVERYTRQGCDVVVVDQTADEHRAGGFHCVKVIIPGTLSMTFGHRYRRVDGLTRLTEVPRLLGYRKTPLALSEINPHPHPFP